MQKKSSEILSETLIQPCIQYYAKISLEIFSEILILEEMTGKLYCILRIVLDKVKKKLRLGARLWHPLWICRLWQCSTMFQFTHFVHYSVVQCALHQAVYPILCKDFIGDSF
jgi:hypothetical protein